MTICRMTFDIAVRSNAPDIYDTKTAIIDAMEKCPLVLGVEVNPNFAEKRNIVDASGMLDKYNLSPLKGN